MSSRLSNRYIQTFVYGYRSIRALKSDFVYEPRMSPRQMETAMSLFRRGFGRGGTSDPQMTYELYMLACEPNYVLNASRNGFELTVCPGEHSGDLRHKIPELDQQLFAMHKLIAPPLPAHHYRRSAENYLEKSASPDVVAGDRYYSHFTYYREISTSPTREAYWKALGNKGIEILGRDPANDRALKLFEEGRALRCIMEAPHGTLRVTVVK
jgi:hypothetical protein